MKRKGVKKSTANSYLGAFDPCLEWTRPSRLRVLFPEPMLVELGLGNCSAGAIVSRQMNPKPS
jgi:hypothetical protein